VTAAAPLRWDEDGPAARRQLALGWCLMGVLCGSMVAGRIETGIFCLLLAVPLAVAAGAKWPSRRWTVALLIGIVLGWLLNLYLPPGEPLASWPRIFGRSATRSGLTLGALLGLRLLGASAALQGVRAAWPAERAADTLLGSLTPLRRLGVPVAELRIMMGLAVRFAPLLEREGRRIAAVQALRAGRPPRGMAEWLERKRAAAVPTLVGALERADRVALALEARHYALRPQAATPRSERALAGKLAGAAAFGTALFWRTW
jgi:energy-coupling factor transporter transmembrane protein EcfT